MQKHWLKQLKPIIDNIYINFRESKGTIPIIQDEDSIINK